MKGNIYGVDIKLMPPDNDPMPILIENNGSAYGTDFFKYEEGFAYYRRFAQVLGAQAQGKPIFIQGYDREMPKSDALTKKIRKLSALQRGSLTLSELVKVSKKFGPSFEIDTSWVKDDYDFTISKIDNPSFDPEEAFHLQAARDENIPMIVFDEIEYLDDCLEFTLMDGSTRRFFPDQIGMIKSAHELWYAPQKYHDLFLSSQLIEGIADNKAFTELVDQLTEDNEYISSTSFTFGLGIDNREKLFKVLDEYPLNAWVKKPASRCGGVGVEICTKKDIYKFLEKFEPESGLEHEQLLDSLAALMFLNDIGNQYENYLSVIEPFVLSVPILNKKTGKEHDACARTVVYSPPVGEPVVLGSQWRLSPSPLGDKEASIEDIYRANLSRGATAAPVEPEYFQIMNEFAIGYIKQFETTLWQLQNREGLMPKVKEILGLMYNDKHNSLTDLDTFRHMFWWTNLQDKARKEGVPDEKFRRGMDDRIKKLRWDMAKKMSIELDIDLFEV